MQGIEPIHIISGEYCLSLFFLIYHSGTDKENKMTETLLLKVKFKEPFNNLRWVNTKTR